MYAAPKAELHVHLEGSIRPSTLLALAQRNHIDLPAKTIEEMQQWFHYQNFAHFDSIFTAISRCIHTTLDYEQIVYEFAETMTQQNVRYAEVTFSPCNHFFSKGISQDIYFTGLTQGRQRAKRDFGVEINWIFDIVRDAALGPGKSPRADYTLKVAIEGMNNGVVGLGLGGVEQDNPPEWFEKWFEQARAVGLHSAPHAGETAGPESIWGAIHALKAERIGHGVRAIEDPELIAFLAETQIPIEVSLTSNLCLGIYSDYKEHPLLKLLDAGIPITINTDDPSLFNTTLNEEIYLLFNTFHLDLNTINTLLLNGIRHSFLPPARKQALESEFQAQLSQLQEFLT